jgi:hypothetical protein
MLTNLIKPRFSSVKSQIRTFKCFREVGDGKKLINNQLWTMNEQARKKLKLETLVSCVKDDFINFAYVPLKAQEHVLKEMVIRENTEVYPGRTLVEDLTRSESPKSFFSRRALSTIASFHPNIPAERYNKYWGHIPLFRFSLANDKSITSYPVFGEGYHEPGKIPENNITWSICDFILFAHLQNFERLQMVKIPDDAEIYFHSDYLVVSKYEVISDIVNYSLPTVNKNVNKEKIPDCGHFFGI